MSSSALEKIQKLLEKYAEVVNEGRVNKYNEEMTKKDFILPLFDALGWKTTDSREVTAEEKISKKRVDYGFRINGIPKFFLEAKSLKEDLDNPKFFEQAVSYAWHKGCTWAVLTNFARVKILNAEWRARNYLQSHFMTLEHWEFVKRLEDLLLLSKESFETDKLDKLAEKYGKKTKKESVDKQLLNDFTRFRAILSRNITKRNADKNLSEEELDESVQRILDRLIFIRNCEDRELEPRNLISNYRQWTSRGKGKLVKSLRDDFGYFDEQYNSKLFAEHLCDSLEIDNEILEDVIVGLYYTKDRAISYDFSIIDADVLGTIYEQYLGHILKKTQKRTQISKSRLHRKEHGIYYTPTFVVDYIVRNTLGELLKQNKVVVERIRVLDPACGSGSFLIKAFDVLNEYYGQTKDYQQTELDLKTGIPFTTKVKILQNNIFGVDLDKQAVEIAQLNLLLKIAEKGYRLPLLEKNVKCGNSLIENELVGGSKSFKWSKEFKEIVDEGGFDVIIGNPPYVNIYLLSKNEVEVKYYQENYFTAHKKFDLYVLFMEKAIRLLRNGGYFGFIVPDKFLSQPYGLNLRKFILDNSKIMKIVNLSGFKVFEEATVENVIVILQKEQDSSSRGKHKIKVVIPSEDPLILRSIREDVKELPQSTYEKMPRHLFRLDVDRDKLKLRKKIEQGSVFVKQICYVNWGARSGDVKTYVVRERKSKLYKPMLDGRDIDRYSIKWDGKYLNYDKDKLYNPMFEELFENEKLIIRDVNAREGIKATFDDQSYYTEHTVSLCLLYHQIADVKRRGMSISKESIKLSKKFNLKYILAILNSTLISFYFKTFIGCGLHVYPDNIRALPIKSLSKSQQKTFVAIVDKILSLSKQLVSLRNKKTDEKLKLEKQIKEKDSEIDELVYKVYGITDAEKEIIENSVK